MSENNSSEQEPVILARWKGPGHGTRRYRLAILPSGDGWVIALQSTTTVDNWRTKETWDTHREPTVMPNE